MRPFALPFFLGPLSNGTPVYLLALETSGRRAAAALLYGDPLNPSGCPDLAWEIRLAHSQRTAQALLPAIAQGLAACGITAAQLGLIAVASGPGSFTGLRIGVTLAKTLAYGIGAAVVAVPTLAALAESVPQQPNRLWTLLDAQRGELFVALYPALTNGQMLAKLSLDERRRPACQEGDSHRDADSGHEFGKVSIVPIETWLGCLRTGDCVAGPPLLGLADQLPQGVFSASLEPSEPWARGVGGLGWRMFLSGQVTDPMQLVPVYYRRSAAEDNSLVL